jgi:hypothetical protein
MTRLILLFTACLFCGCQESSNDGPAKTVSDVTLTTEAKEEVPVAEPVAVVEESTAVEEPTATKGPAVVEGAGGQSRD